MTATTSAPHADPSTGSIAIVLPYDGHPALAHIARHTEQAVIAAAGTRPVVTVIVDGSAAATAAQNTPTLTQKRLVLTGTTVSWGGLVARGIRHALALGARTIVIADPEIPAAQEPLTRAVGMLREQVGVVCSPLAQPWWRRLLAIHLVRPLLSAALGITVTDPHTRTLVLSADVAELALQQHWALQEIDWEVQHGLGVLAVARQAGLRVLEAPVREPQGQPRFPARLFDEDDTETLLAATLRLCRLDQPLGCPPVPGWLLDRDADRLPSPKDLSDAREVITSASTPLAGLMLGPEQWSAHLLRGWREVRGGRNAHLVMLTLKDAYADRLLGWLPLLGTGYDDGARASASKLRSDSFEAPARPSLYREKSCSISDVLS